ncbi:MAG: signal peptidase II [Geminocystis sp.]|nr:signal peptidase II [Geminocystis sp.]HIK37934.1 lipoprotein signal peptidase [Geminocystis sp. M7585_C2015_104]MCS7147074.1 signal peptidase II [Geminocystis sp.]MCX8079278.1 signal peptidase II [Geminocystis sp.]MDW8115897.1 signal peptidase II [Geminocystis sp.]
MRKNRQFWLVAIMALTLDQITKYLTVITFENVGDTIPLWPGVFHITYVRNTGAAFSFFQGGVGWLKWLSLIVSVVLIIFAWKEKLSTLEQWGYGFILAGALGNGVDRFLFGYVVDFFDFRLINFPVFNVADVCINIGVILLIYTSFGPGKTRNTP